MFDCLNIKLFWLVEVILCFSWIFGWIYTIMAYLARRILFRPKEIITRFYNKIVITDDGSTIISLHRDEGFPYEHSRPLPNEKTDTSILKMSDYDEVKRVFKDLKPEIARKQLASVTLTTVHRWFPRARDKKAKNNEMNRPYL